MAAQQPVPDPGSLRESLAPESRIHRRVIESALDFAILTTGPQGVIETWSPGAERILGWSAREAVGRDVAITYTPADRAAGEPELERIIARTEGVANDVRWHQRADGSTVFIDGVCRALFGDDGHVIGFVKIGRDVTARHRSEEELRESMTGLRDANEVLERRVAERTAALAESNRRLLEEIRQREAVDAERSELVHLLISAEENERGRLSRELHDRLGQQLTGLLLALHVLELDEKGTDRADRIRELARLTDAIALDVQTVALQLRPPALDTLGLELAVRGYLEDWSERHGIAADFHADPIDADVLTDEVEATLYRIVQEGLNNVLKHARAERVSLLLQRRRGTIGVILEDDGVGFDPHDPDGQPLRRLGLRGMRERVALLNGEFEIESSPAGTTLFARLPVVRSRRGET